MVIGSIAPIGIGIKNAISLDDFASQLRADGVPLRESSERPSEVRLMAIGGSMAPRD